MTLQGLGIGSSEGGSGEKSEKKWEGAFCGGGKLGRGQDSGQVGWGTEGGLGPAITVNPNGASQVSGCSHLLRRTSLPEMA